MVAQSTRAGLDCPLNIHSDPMEQLLDMKADPGETRNLAGEGRYASVVEDHRRLLRDWESQLDIAQERE